VKSDFTYDLIIIGGGISACVFASKYLKNNIKKKIALIEIGRGLGGRSSTRISKIFNGWKISIMLEEIGYEYKVTKVDIGKDEQFKPEFIKLSPFGKIPVIIDHDSSKSIFESGAILMYLADKSGKLYNEKDRLVINQWLMAQMGTVGPMIGQHHQFHHYNPGKSEFGEERYFKINKPKRKLQCWRVSR